MITSRVHARIQHQGSIPEVVEQRFKVGVGSAMESLIGYQLLMKVCFIEYLYRAKPIIGF